MLITFVFYLQQIPFANQSAIGDLAKFYRECFNAPPLESFSSNIDISEDEQDAEDVGKQLEQFENESNQFENLITSLYISENQNNS